MALIRITAEGNNASGKTTVLSLIHAMLKEKGFTNVEVVNGEERLEVFQTKGEQAIQHAHVVNAKIELVEKFGTIS